MHYHILGTDHDHQLAGWDDHGLHDKIQAVFDQDSLVLIAEEVNANENVLTFGRKLIGPDKWLSIDMTDDERKMAKIYDDLHCPATHAPGLNCRYQINPYIYRAESIREHFWLERIEKWCSHMNVQYGTVVITCGDNHVPFLAGKAFRRGHSVSVDRYPTDDKSLVWGPFIVYED